MKRRVGVLISGRGSNLQALLDAQGPLCPYEIVVVVSSTPEAFGLERAQSAGVVAVPLDHRPFRKERAAFDRLVHEHLVEHGVELVALAGFMRILSKEFVELWAGRMLNIHPSLLPAFAGLHPHERALEAGVKVHGCSVHWVTEGVDSGPIVGQAAVPVLAEDTPETLATRVLAAEHFLYPACLSMVCGGPAIGPGEGEPLLANAFVWPR
jgi:phosphoribosylglycinamide formyltransferase 1